MKRSIYSICIAVLGLSLVTVQGAEGNKKAGRAAPRSMGKSASVHPSVRSTGVRSSGNFHSSPQITARSVRTTTPRHITAVNHNNRVVNTRRNVVVNRNRNVTLNHHRVSTDRNIASTHNRTVVNTRNRTVVNNNRFANRRGTVVNRWTGSRFAGHNYAAFRDYHRQWHDRSWWRGHYNRIVFVGGGWYFWNAGYWFPAWGYDPYYSYPYDGPIYGYNGLAPDQVVVDVQTQLQRDGYYSGPVDGVLGPMTRSAIAAFQADHDLAVTSAVDEPTLSTLGIS